MSSTSEISSSSSGREPVERVHRSTTPLATLLRHYNLFYPLSALCLFAGCFAMIQQAALRPADPLLWILIGVVNLYELLLIGLAVVLIRMRIAVRDGRFLLLLFVLLLCDATFLLAEAVNRMGLAGLWVGLGFGVFAVAKVGLTLWLIGLRLTVGRWAILGIELVAIASVGGIYAALSPDGVLDRRLTWAAWWVVGVLLALKPALCFMRPRGWQRVYEPMVRNGLAFLPPVLLLVHLAAAGWVYRAHFTPAFATPIVLGFAVWLPRLSPTRSPRGLVSTQMILVAAAAVLSINAPASLELPVHAFVLSPWRVALLGGALVLGWAAWRQWCWQPLLPGLAMLGVSGIAPNPTLLARRVASAMETALPRTGTQWALAVIGLAFVLLALGAGWNFWSTRQRRQRRRAMGRAT